MKVDWIWTMMVELIEEKEGLIQVSVFDSGWRRAIDV